MIINTGCIANVGRIPCICEYADFHPEDPTELNGTDVVLSNFDEVLKALTFIQPELVIADYVVANLSISSRNLSKWHNPKIYYKWIIK